MNQQQFDKMRTGRGFIAALDQSGGSTPKALKNYGVDEDAYSNDEEKVRVMHEMRSRIMGSPAIHGDRILGAIPVEGAMNRQFELGRPIADAGLVPILEPEIDIHSPHKADAEAMLKKALLDRLEQWPSDKYLMFKLTLPEEDNFYSELVDHPNVVRVVALSGGYSREEANNRLSRNKGVVASFSRALTEGLFAQQSDEEFDKTLDTSIQSIFEASNA